MEGIKRTLGGMSRRSKFENNMHLGTTHLQEFYSEFENEFLEFFPQLIEHVAPYKS
jgi:acyl carrier protein phosphodiesterase